MKQKQRYIVFPETWGDLTPEDWREVLKIRQRVVAHGGRYSEHDITVKTVVQLLKNRGLKEQPSDSRYIELISRLSKTLGWLWHAEGSTISLVYKDTRNLLPKVREWLGPADHGSDLLFGEFRLAFAVLRNYEEHPSERDLDVLAGLLYRPEASEQMQHEQQLRRLPYDWDTFSQKEERGKQMERWQVWGIYAWFAWFCEYLTTGTFIIDGCEVSFAPLFNHSSSTADSSPSTNSGFSLQQICLTLAESHVFGTAKDVDRTPLLTVMQKLLMDYHSLMKIKNHKK